MNEADADIRLFELERDLLALADLQRKRLEAEIDEFEPAAFAPAPMPLSVRKVMRILLVKVAMNETTPLKLAQRVEIEIENR